MRPVFSVIVFAAAVLACGCASNPEYGIKADPVMRGVEGKEDGRQVREGIKQENLRALEEGDEPIFRTDDRY